MYTPGCAIVCLDSDRLLCTVVFISHDQLSVSVLLCLPTTKFQTPTIQNASHCVNTDWSHSCPDKVVEWQELLIAGRALFDNYLSPHSPVRIQRARPAIYMYHVLKLAYASDPHIVTTQVEH